MDLRIKREEVMQAEKGSWSKKKDIVLSGSRNGTLNDDKREEL